MLRDLYDKQGFKNYELNLDHVLDSTDLQSCI
jgi:hypothetical protein